MDKRAERNHRVKRKIMKALFDLMETNHFSEISVTDIVRCAGVARQSYYRNFSSKEEIIEEFLNENRITAAQGMQGMKRQDQINQMGVHIFQMLKEHRREIMILYRAGFARHIQENIDGYLELVIGDMPASSPERYKLYAYSGAVQNVARKWLESGAIESCEEIAKVVYEFRAADVIHNIEDAEQEEWYMEIPRK